MNSLYYYYINSVHLISFASLIMNNITTINLLMAEKLLEFNFMRYFINQEWLLYTTIHKYTYIKPSLLMTTSQPY